MAFERGRVRVENGSTIVRWIWTVFYANLSGAFVPGEGLTWGADGVGVFVRIVASSTQLFLYRTSGSNPAIGDTITGGTSGATCDVQNVEDVASFDTEVEASDFFTREDTGIAYFLSSTINPDNFVLTAPYQEDTENEVSYSIKSDFTVFFNFALPEVGEIDPEVTMARAIQSIEAQFLIGLNRNQRFFTQASHGFALGDVVYFDSVSGWQKADASSIGSGAAVGIVDFVVPINTFRVVYQGYIDAGLSGLSTGTLYYVDDVTPGALRSTPPIGVGKAIRPVLLALSSTTGLVVTDQTQVVEAATAATLLGNWVNLGAPDESARFWRDPYGHVYLQGAVDNNVDASPSTILTLPVGYRPANRLVFPGIDGAGNLVRLEVEADGDVIMATGTPANATYLNGIKFRAEG